ncbi:prenyltransferase/squalene oxidase repeat-containing protein [Streptomyces sp. C1-2]|uniref:prenyltransferase/squalene oxidase repeat-containing protein n=1 Tax=Streptomyces sp. C1-2 TaxID=2720022 RepID=UPI0014323515|nr:prenyltransferase/squalene oxidase repeat-containing protein [Streptomyces sp. C1-2]NJP73049.1 terpene cyclase/mutase family protein [Streptomyces sp. C1-2]
MIVRRCAAVLAAAAVIGAGAAPAVAASPSPSPSKALPAGLFGTTDPTYDGVWRQSLALLAQHTVGVQPAAKAVDWLTGQQCANGAFAAFRAEPAKSCDAKTQVDTNSTAAAVQALAALGGHRAEVGKAVDWLKDNRNKDGGWGYSPGGASDANSTSVVIGALTAAGEKDLGPSYDALLTFSLPCDGEGAGAFAFQPDKKGKLTANADATAAGVLGALGQGLAAEAGRKKFNSCSDGGEPTPSRAAAHGASYLAGAMAKDGHLVSALPGSTDQPDYGNTADAVVALAAQGGAARAAKPLAWLKENSAAWAKQNGPGAYAQLVFAAHATGTDPRHFGGQDLVSLLNATGPAPQKANTENTENTQNTGKADKDEKKDEGGFGLYWFIGVCLVAGIGAGFLLSGRRKAGQRS